MKPRAAPPDPAAAEPAVASERAPPAGVAPTPARGSPEASPPPSGSRASLSIVALSEDPLLLEALTLAAINQAAVVTSPSADRFADQLVANAAAVALIDAAAAPTPLEGFIATVHQQFPQLLLLLAAPAALQNQFAAQLADGTLFRFAHKPASAQRLKLFVDAALLRRQTLLDQALGVPLPNGPAAVNPVGQSPFGHSGRGRRPLWLMASILLALVAAAVGAALWYRSPPGPAPSALQPGAPATSNSTAPDAAATQAARAAQTAQDAEAERDAIDRAAAERAERDRLISDSEARAAVLADQVKRTAIVARTDQAHVYVQLAQKRLASGALLEPADDSARSYLQAAIALAPDDADVRAVSVALGDALIAKLRAALAAGDVDSAARWLAACRDYHVNEGTLEQLSTQLASLQRARSAHAEQLLAWQRAFEQRLADGQLLEPADDGALAQYRDLKAADPDNAALPAMLHSLRSALAADVQARLARNDLAGADQRLQAASAAGLGGDELASAAAALQRAQDAALPAVIPEARLQRAHFVTPVYPPDALAQAVSGSVELEFTVTPAGNVANVQVVSAEPRGVFEHSAIAALSQSRYHPVERDGVAVAQRARVRVRFKP
ncbi:MAG: TonB family protein [Steroidobacterales bacterium]